MSTTLPINKTQTEYFIEVTYVKQHLCNILYMCNKCKQNEISGI